jgi:hypothetical protein
MLPSESTCLSEFAVPSIEEDVAERGGIAASSEPFDPFSSFRKVVVI